MKSMGITQLVSTSICTEYYVKVLACMFAMCENTYRRAFQSICERQTTGCYAERPTCCRIGADIGHVRSGHAIVFHLLDTHISTHSRRIL